MLAANRGQPVTITHPTTTISVIAGLDDPQAAQMWLLQALTGRRASEILMLDFHHASPEMTLRYAATLAATAEAEFLRHKKIDAQGADIMISSSDIYDMTQLAARTDRVLPNRVCLLIPLKSCDKGNACLSCGHFATDSTHPDELVAQLAKTVALLDVHREQYRQRSGRELTDSNVWIHERRREIASLDEIRALRTKIAEQESAIALLYGQLDSTT